MFDKSFQTALYLAILSVSLNNMGGIERPYVTSYSDRVTPYATRFALPRLDRDRWTSYQENGVCFVEM